MRGTPRFERAKNGGLTLKVDEVYIESRFNPQEENRRLFENHRNPKSRFYIFLGAGLGYHINLLLGGEDAGALLVEQNRDIFRASLFIIRPEVLRRLVPLVGTDADRISEEIGTFLKEEVIVVPHRRSMQGRKQYYGRVSGIIKNRISEMAASRLTGEKAKKLWLKNVLRNCTLHRRKIFTSGSLYSLFKGPAVLVASGPFLEEVDDRLRKLGRRLPLISLLPSVPYLLHNGIRPDFVVSTDAGFYNRYRLFSALASLCTGCLPQAVSSEANNTLITPAVDRMPLIAALSIDRPVIRQWPGDVYVFSHGLPIEKQMKKTSSRLLTVPMQGTAAIVMILIARAMGFSPLYLAGFDFAMQGLKSHHRGAGFDELLELRVSRFETRQTIAAERLRRALPVEAEDSAGNRIYTTQALMLYRNWLEQELDLKDVIRLNRGLPVSGMEEDAPAGTWNSLFREGEGTKDVPRAGKRHSHTTPKRECEYKPGWKRELDRKEMAHDLEEMKRKVSGHMKAHQSSGTSATMIYRFFYGEIPSGLSAEDLEQEAIEAMEELNRTV